MRPRNQTFRCATVLAVAFLLLATACEKVGVTRFYQRGVVATVSPIASEIGRDVIEQGGNAFDAAIAVAFTLAVTYPQAGNIGGGGFAVVRKGSDGEVAALDFREVAPGLATPTMYLDSTGEVIKGRSTSGSLAVGVPGSVAGLYALWEKYGTWKWVDLVTPAARLADTGFIVNPHLAESFKEYRKVLAEFEETRNVFLPNGEVLREGDRLLQPDLARSLYTIAEEGPSAFYTGMIADSLVACMQKHGGLISYSDLEHYRPIWRQPVHFKFDSLDVFTMPPPSSGGIAVGQILKLLEPYNLAQFTADSPEYLHLFCEASRLAFADRSEYLGDPAFYNVPTTLLDSAYLADRRAVISPDHAGRSEEVSPGNPLKYESESTTHFSICDSDGNMVAITTTINELFGSGLMVSGAGFLLNNEMDDFAIKPGFANTWGLVGGEANAVAPGKRMLSSMAPTVILKDGRPFMILGSPGGSKIITTVAEAIINFTRFGLSLQKTAEYPRFHHQWLPDILYLEKGGFDVPTIQRLIRYGHQVEERTPYGDLEMIYINPTGMMTGASDNRNGGVSLGCNQPLMK
jgi:gamma-glutamyltranspeptidase / glutathione hydrolase